MIEDKDSRMETGGMWGERERETDRCSGDLYKCFIYVVYVKIDIKPTERN